MSNWTDQKASQINKRHENERKQREWRLHEAAVLRERGPELVRELQAIVERDAANWNEVFEGREDCQIQRTDRSVSIGFRMNKREPPSATIDISFDPNSLRLTVDIQRANILRKGSNSIESYFSMSLSEGGDTVNLTPCYSNEQISMDTASQILIETLTDETAQYSLSHRTRKAAT